MLSDRRTAMADAPVDKLFAVVKSIGGRNGWYTSNMLWQIRGLMDEACGGVGLRRGRVNQEDIAVGDASIFGGSKSSICAAGCCCAPR